VLAIPVAVIPVGSVSDTATVDSSVAAVLRFSTVIVEMAGSAAKDRKLIPDESPAAVGENRRTAGETPPVVLVLLAERHLTRRLFASMLGRIDGLSLPSL